jgi:hypothetical protein
LKERLGWLAFAWVTTAVGLVIIAWGMLPAMAMFPVLSPVGFLVLLLTSESNGGFYAPLACGWLYYLILTVWAARAQTRFGFACVYGILCISLLLNLGGCEAAKHINFGCQISPKIELASSH